MKEASSERILLLLLVILFLTQFVLTLFAHALVLRFDMSHTLVLLMITLSLVYKRKKYEQFEAERFITFWLTVSYVAMVALCVVHIIYSLQILSLLMHMDSHEMDIHYHKLILGLGSVSLIVKFFCVFYIDSGFEDSKMAQFSKALFHFLPPLVVLVVALYRSAKILVWFDPVLNGFCSIVTFACLISPLKEHVLILLLAVPKSIDIDRMKNSFDKEFDYIHCDNLIVWRDSKTRINVNLHISFNRFLNYAETCSKIENFFQSHGAHRVCIEPQFVPMK